MPERERTPPQYESFHELYKNYITKELIQKTKTLKLTSYSKLDKEELILAIIELQMEKDGSYYMESILDGMQPDGYGFLRAVNYSRKEKGIYISASQIRRFEIRRGDKVIKRVREPKNNEEYYGLLQVSFVNDHNAEKMKKRPHSQALTPLYPDERIKLETEIQNYSTRIMDLVTPIGLGQRGLIVAPPKASKTSLLEETASAISTNKPGAKLFILLVGERSEEIIDLERSVGAVEVVHSTFDEPPEHHVRIAESLLECARRLVEIGEDVIILMDSITRLAHTCNLVIPPNGRTLSDGLDPASLHKPETFFGAARNIGADGSLTIFAAVLVDTGSHMDDMIYKEFRGTGNMGLHLDRKLSERRAFPVIDIGRSLARRKELLIGKSGSDTLWRLRNLLTDSTDFTERSIHKLKKSKNNEDFFKQL